MEREDQFKYLAIARDFFEGKVDEDSAYERIQREIIDYYGQRDYYFSHFSGLAAATSESLPQDLLISEVPLEPLRLFTLFLHMLGYWDDEADFLLKIHRLFHVGGGKRTIPAKWDASVFAKISALAEAPIRLLKSSSQAGINRDHGYGPSIPWWEFTDVVEPQNPKLEVSPFFQCGRYLLTGLGWPVGLVYLQSKGFHQLSITSIDGMGTWRVAWDELLTDLAVSHYHLAGPAVLTHAEEFANRSSLIYRISWLDSEGSVSPNGLVKLYCRIFSPRTHLFSINDGTKRSPIVNPLYKRADILAHLQAIGLT